MVDYSKWKKIEISDDEDETHPNIDTPSLFRWRHKARLERQEEQRKAAEEVKKKRAQLKAKEKQEQENLSPEERQKLLDEMAEIERKEAELQKRKTRQPWNVDTIGQETWSGTVLNKNCLKNDQKDEEIDYEDEAAVSEYEAHVRTYEADMRQFAFHANFEDRRRFLLAHPNLVNQFTVDYLSLWCIQLKIDGKTALLGYVARQAVTVQMILDLAKTLGGGIDPRSCLSVFFERSARAKEKFDRMFEDELADFMERVGKAEQYRMTKALEEQEKDPQALIGPGGLNAQEVFESLPVELQKCFESRSREDIEGVLAAMDPADAEYHMKRCVDAGLWSTEVVEKEDEAEVEQILAAMASSSLNDKKEFTDDGDTSSDDSEE